MGRRAPYPREVRERAVRMVFEHQAEYSSQWAAITSIDFTQELTDAGVLASVGSVGDAYDNAMAESFVDSFKTEKIDRDGPWKTMSEVEIATLEWVDWYNHERLHSACDRRPPAEYERLRLAAQQTQ